MTKTLYEKFHYLNLECVAVWDDFDGPGAYRDKVVWKEQRGPFETEEQADQEWEVFCKYVDNTERENLRRIYNVADSKISAPPLFGGKIGDFYPTDFYFQHTHKKEFQEIK